MCLPHLGKLLSYKQLPRVWMPYEMISRHMLCIYLYAHFLFVCFTQIESHYVYYFTTLKKTKSVVDIVLSQILVTSFYYMREYNTEFLLFNLESGL